MTFRGHVLPQDKSHVKGCKYCELPVMFLKRENGGYACVDYSPDINKDAIYDYRKHGNHNQHCPGRVKAR